MADLGTIDASLLVELDVYQSFFKRKSEIELEYADQLRKLNRQQEGFERKFDEDKAKHPTWRASYIAIRQTLAREAGAHQGLGERIKALSDGLTTFKEDKERMRRRIKEQLRTSVDQHVEYTHQVQRMRKTYQHKVDEVKAQEEVESEPSWPPEHWQQRSESPARERRDSTASSRGGGGGGNGSSAGDKNSERDSPPLHSPPIAHQPQVFISGATSSGTSSGGVPPSGKTNMFDQLAKRDWTGDKNRLVRVVGSLAKGVEGGGGIKPSAVKSGRSRQNAAHLKLRREAEQADRDYRDGIFLLETLRLQRYKTGCSAVASIRQIPQELSAMLRDKFQQYLSALAVVGVSEEVLEGPRETLSGIDPEMDYINLSKKVKDADPMEPPVYYQNAFVGECKNLLFGVSLTDYLTTHPNILVPLIVQICIAQLESTGIATEGIYRIPGKLGTVQQLVHQVEKDEEQFGFDSRVDPHAVAGVLKLYLRQLPTPLFPFPTADRLALSYDFAQDPVTHMGTLTRRIKRLSSPQQATLKALCKHLFKVVEHVEQNKMNAPNLGMVFTPVVFGEDENLSLESAKSSRQDTVMEILIMNHKTIFAELPVEPTGASSGGVRQSSMEAKSTSTPLTGTPTRRRSLTAPSSTQVSPLLGVSAEEGPKSSASPNPSETDRDSVFELYRKNPGTLLPSAPPSPSTVLAISEPLPLQAPSLPAVVSHIPLDFANDLRSPTPPLSAAGGRHIPAEDTFASSSSPGAGASSSSSPFGTNRLAAYHAPSSPGPSSKLPTSPSRGLLASSSSVPPSSPSLRPVSLTPRGQTTTPELATIDATGEPHDEPLSLRLERGTVMQFGRKAKKPTATLDETTLAVRLPKAAKNASRLHCTARISSEASEVDFLTVEVRVLGQNGMKIDGKLWRAGETALLPCEAGQRVELAFWGWTSVLIVAESEIKQATLPPSVPVTPKAASRTLQFGSPATSAFNSLFDGSDISDLPSSPDRQPFSSALHHAQPIPDSIPRRGLSREPSPAYSEDSLLSQLSSPILDAHPSSDDEVEPIDELAVVLGARAVKLVETLALDLPGMIASAIVFQPRATVSVDDIARALLEETGAMWDVLEDGNRRRTPERELAAIEAWWDVIEKVLREEQYFGCIENQGLKDATGAQLLPEYYYQPEHDPSKSRVEALEPFVKRVRGARTSKGGTRYFWRKPGGKKSR
ncbi:Rho GTPase activation protein domain containing protein [Pseudohyphozyma bogoriensis]|nr:Rho GTPase activation protein domain containing protein [Pseudohyphozyma bogoriensis]